MTGYDALRRSGDSPRAVGRSRRSDATLRLTVVPAVDMGYACPVCETPQRDGEHLAHHLAFTAMLHGGDHEAWLDEHVSDWAARDPAGLAADVTPHAADAEYHEVFADTAERGRPDVDLGVHDGVGSSGHDHAGHGRAARGGPKAADSTGEPDPAVAEALREAREMAREADDGGGGAGDSDDDNDSAGDSAPDDDNDSASDETEDPSA